MTELCTRLLVRGIPLRRLAKPGLPYLQVTSSSPTPHTRHVSDYFKTVYPVNDQTIMKEGPERIRVGRRNEIQFSPNQQYSDVTTIYEAFQRGKRVSNDGNFLGWRAGPGKPYQWMSFSQAEEKARLFGSGLVSLGIRPGGESFVGIYSRNRPEWTLTDLACIHYSMVSVPLYPSLGREAFQYIAHQTDMTALVCDNIEKAEPALENSASLPHLKTIIVIDLPPEGLVETKHRYEAVGLRLVSFDDVIAAGTANPCDLVIPGSSDMNTILYTSGTTGKPKGVPLTQRHHISNHAIVHACFDESSHGQPTDYHLSYLPLAHAFERGNMYHLMANGAQAGFSQGDPLLLIDDVHALRPTLFFGVPRIYNRIHHQVMLGLSHGSPIKRAVFNFAYQQKLKDLHRGIMRNDTMWDKIVFKKIQNIFGGRIRYLFSGAASISAEVATFYRVVMGCPFFEGYGQTETTSCISHTMELDMTSGHVGVPGGSMEVKLVDVPELDYFAEEDVGEVCVRGGNVMTGYFKDPERTKEALEDDGWLHTGDIGRWNKNGTLSLIDRKKHILKLAQGLYIAPEKIENCYIRLPLLTQLFIYGDSLKSYIVGIGIPDPTELEKLAKTVGATGSFEELCRHEKVEEAVLQVLREHGKAEGLQGFEQLQAIHLHTEPFSEDNGLLTPTLKSKRKEIQKAFQEQLDELYQKKTDIRD